MGRRSGYKRSNRQLSGGREQKRASDVGVGGVFILLAFGLLFDATFWFCAIILGFFATLFTVIGLLWIYQRLSGEKARSIRLQQEISLSRKAALQAKIKFVVSEHLETLIAKRIHLISIDDYGISDVTKWNKEVAFFFNNIVLPHFADDEQLQLSVNNDEINSLILQFIEAPVIQNVPKYKKDEWMSGFTTGISPRDFEHWCASALSSRGWVTKATPASGDQGADVIAERDGQRAVIQCKLYTAPVGNKAVQEVFAAKSYYNGTIAAVISTSGYTSSAKTLAASTGVLLLDRTEFARFDDLTHVF